MAAVVCVGAVLAVVAWVAFPDAVVPIADESDGSTDNSLQPHQSQPRTSNESSRSDGAQEPDPHIDEQFDVRLLLDLPPDWPADLHCTLETSKLVKGSPGTWDSHPLTLHNDRTENVPLLVPSTGLIFRLISPDAMTIIGGMTWLDTQTLILMSAHEMIALGEMNKKQQVDGRPVLLAKGVKIAKGAAIRFPIKPWVSVSAKLFAAGGAEVAPPTNTWRVSYSVPRTESISGVNWTTELSGGEANFSAPATATAWVQPDIASIDELGAIEPSEYRVSIPTSQTHLDLAFTFKTARRGIIIVQSLDGVPLDAEFHFDPPITYRFSWVPKETGKYHLLLSQVARTITVWSLGYETTSFRTTDVPSDGSSLDVRLTPARTTVMIVRIQFEDDVPVFPVDLDVTCSTTDRDQHSWNARIAFPASGELQLKGQAGQAPHVEPHSESYTFELVDKSLEDTIPVRTFVARQVCGIRVELANSPDTAWAAKKPVKVIISRPPAADDTPFARGDGAAFEMLPGQKSKRRIAHGEWLIQAWQEGEVSLIGQAHVTVVEGFVDVEVTPTAAQGWRALKIIDQTGKYSAKGTVFLLGLPTLAGMRDTAEAARSAMELATRNGARGVPTVGALGLSDSGGAVAAYSDGWVLVPTWFPGRVTVMPAGALAVYEGIIDMNSSSVTVRKPVWAGSVSFEPASTATEAERAVLSESGWFIAIRDYADVRDISTMDGTDVKVPAKDGAATIASLPPGPYVARYVRASVREVEDPETGHKSHEIGIEWFDGAKFDVQPGALNVMLPTVRE